MAEQSKDILSEYTKDMTPEQRAELQEKVSNMTEEELKEFKSSFVSYGKMVIYTYLPKELLPESFEDLTFEEFFELYGQADCAREMRIEDIETGVAKGIADNFSNDE